MSKIFDEDIGAFRKQTLSNGQVLAFSAGFWRRRRVGFVATIVLTLIAIGFEMAVRRAAQGLVDAVVKGRGVADAVWRVWGVFVAIYVIFAVIRNVSMRPYIAFASRTMKEMANEAFAKVPSFSVD
jgi:ABC-type multidrug transport system fused ATPase/permease subunit